ncbi:class I SAM-dependent methyltransferase [Hirschia litorea]|uniref:Class I SAM-dependent methyltransferase n=1 Tax=Hirschia litorea TaxID=1199156 RepID=A0ABW2IMA8_9PROT
MTKPTQEISLTERLKAMIQADGPIPISVFMQIALFDRKQGYYATRPGLGTDFTTAPEISQVFGEMVGIWAAHEWQQLGCPSPFYLVEMGPGRGIMMSDIWRATSKVAGFHDAARPYLIEPSPALRKIQAQNLTQIDTPIWVDSLQEIPIGPTLLLANEVLDCLPIRQYIRHDGAWCERKVGIDQTGAFQLGISGPIAKEHTSSSDIAHPDLTGVIQDVVEISTALDAFIDTIAERLKQGHSRALFIDYGPANATPADTLRAYSNGDQIDPLTQIGEVDLTADVDFSKVKQFAVSKGLNVSGPTPQGWFLNALGGVERVNALIDQNPQKADEIAQGAMRIMAPDQMGERFQAICLSSPKLPAPIGF